MSVDASAVRHMCPFCDYDGPTRSDVKRHVTQEEDGGHHNVNGFTMEETIETYEDESKMPLHDRIIAAADKFDELTHEAAEMVAEKANVSKYLVVRVWEDEGIPLDLGRGPCPTRWSELTENQRQILSMFHQKDNITQEDIAEVVDVSRGTVSRTKETHGFLLSDKYSRGHLDKITDRIVKKLEHDSDSQVETETQDTQGEGENSSENNDLPDVDTTQFGMGDPTSSDSHAVKDMREFEALQDAGVDMEVEVNFNEGSFSIMKKLIESGYPEIARKFHDE